MQLFVHRAVRHTSHVTRHRGDALTAIDGTSILDISGGGVSCDAAPSSGEREGQAAARRLNQDSLRSLIVGPEGCFCSVDVFFCVWSFVSTACFDLNLTVPA